MTQTIKVSKETKEIIEALFWILELSGGNTGVTTSSSNKSFYILNNQSCND